MTSVSSYILRNKNILINALTEYTLIRLITVISLFSSLVLVGCSFNNKIDPTSLNEVALYELAQSQIISGNYRFAIQTLHNIENYFPFSKHLKLAQLSLIYAHYALNELEYANIITDRFIRLFPQHRHIDYVYYMKGLINFPKPKTIFQQMFDVDLSQRDVRDVRDAFTHFTRLTKKFPDSEYTLDSLKRMEFLRNLLARNEMHISNYYFRRKAYLAAANRARYLVENFQQTPAVPDALAMMIESYHKMGMNDLVESSIDILRINYPTYPALSKNGEFDFAYSSNISSSWLNRVTLGVLGKSRPPGFNSKVLYNPTKK